MDDPWKTTGCPALHRKPMGRLGQPWAGLSRPWRAMDWLGILVNSQIKCK